MNRISFAGRLAADAEVRHTASGDAVCSFRVASDIGYGERKTTNWFACQVWGKRAESSLVDYLTKGQQVTVWGALTLREWQDKDGQTRLSPDVRVDDIALQGGRRDDDEPRQQRPRAESSPQRTEQRPRRTSAPDALDGDDIPF